MGKSPVVSATLDMVLAVVAAWLFVHLVMRGVKDAAVINYIVTVAKVLPILVFIVIAIIAFKADVFTGNFWGNEGYSFVSIWAYVSSGPLRRCCSV